MGETSVLVKSVVATEIVIGGDEANRPADSDGWLSRGIRHLGCSEFAQSLRCFEEAQRLRPENARARAYRGLALALAERRFQEAVEVCRAALKQEFFNPELYIVMARLHLSFGFKGEAVRYLRRAHMIDPGNTEVSLFLEQIGQRRGQVLGFLPRTHLLNRWLGLLRTRIARALGGEADSSSLRA